MPRPTFPADYHDLDGQVQLPQVAVQCLVVLLLLIKPLDRRQGKGVRQDDCHRLVVCRRLTLSTSLFFEVIFEKDSPTFFISRMKPAPLMAAVSFALGSWERGRSLTRGHRTHYKEMHTSAVVSRNSLSMSSFLSTGWLASRIRYLHRRKVRMRGGICRDSSAYLSKAALLLSMKAALESSLFENFTTVIPAKQDLDIYSHSYSSYTKTFFQRCLVSKMPG